jgi:hypothetical protein
MQEHEGMIFFGLGSVLETFLEMARFKRECAPKKESLGRALTRSMIITEFNTS